MNHWTKEIKRQTKFDASKTGKAIKRIIQPEIKKKNKGKNK